jgi:hypothetical protein
MSAEDWWFQGLHNKRGNFDEFKSSGLHEGHTVAIWNLETIQKFA